MSGGEGREGVGGLGDFLFGNKNQGFTELGRLF